MSKSYCSPHRIDYFQKTGTCLNDEDLDKLASHVNLTTKDSLANAFKDYCKGKLNKDFCWVQSPVVKKNTSLHKQLEKNFRPTKPLEWYLNKFEWLTNEDIQKVMEQYEIKYKEFNFLGVVARDFDSVCFIKSICKMNIEESLNKGNNKFAFIINLDKHNQPGSHWVALFCSLDIYTSKFGIGYYDSSGHPPTNRNL